jgi:hypothetical protein
MSRRGGTVPEDPVELEFSEAEPIDVAVEPPPGVFGARCRVESPPDELAPSVASVEQQVDVDVSGQNRAWNR